MTDTPTRRLLQSCLQLQLAIMNDRDEKSSLITSPKGKFHLPSEIKLIIADMCDWKTILSLRATSVEWYGTVHTALTAGNELTRLKSGLWYTEGKLKLLHDPQTEALMDLQLRGDLLGAAAAGKLELEEYLAIGRRGNTGGLDSTERAIYGDLDHIGKLWAPIFCDGKGVHRIFTMLHIPDPEETCRLVLKEESLVHGLAEEFPGIISGADAPMVIESKAELDEDPVMEPNLSNGEIGDENEDKAEDRKIFFGDDSLFEPPVKGPIPCRVRYKFSYPASFYNMSEEHYEMRKAFEYESSDTKLFFRRTDDKKQDFITVKDAWIALEKHLGLILRWEERYAPKKKIFELSGFVGKFPLLFPSNEETNTDNYYIAYQ